MYLLRVVCKSCQLLLIVETAAVLLAWNNPYLCILGKMYVVIKATQGKPGDRLTALSLPKPEEETICDA